MFDSVTEPWVTTFSSRRLAPAMAPLGQEWPRRRRAAGRSRVARTHRPRTSAAAPCIYSIVDGDAASARDGRSSDHGARQSPRPVLNQGLFRGALSRERRRADCFAEVFAVLTIRVIPALVHTVVAALAAATADTDFIGWMEQGNVLAVILTDITGPGDAAVRQVEARLRRELAHRLDAAATDPLVIDSYIHAGPRLEGLSGLAATDPLLDDLRRIESRLTVFNIVKRGVDIVASALLLLLTAPLFAVIAILVKRTSPGPVLFRQRRVGYMAKPFTMLKFRTMQANNDPALHRQFVTEFITSSGSHRAVSSAATMATAAAAPFKIKNDPRTTPIGRLLRRTSLDELPQLWNVLMGDMSLVGPRPPIAYELENYRSWHWRRVLEAKPGVTGLWQVRGRSRTTFDEMVRLDLEYARTRSLWLDLMILVSTPRAVVTGRGAS